MALSTVAEQSSMKKYEPNGLDRPTTATSFTSQSIMRYIGPRTIGLNHTNSFQGSLRNFTLTSLTTNNASSVVTPPTTSHGLAALIHASSFSTISPIQSIDGDRAIDEFRELSKLNQTLSDQILICCNLEAHNRAQELQIEWLLRHADQNTQVIEKMFRQETESAQQLIEDARRHRGDFERKLSEIHQTTLASDEQYQQLLAKRNNTNKDLFTYQRQLAQNRAEIEFLSSRIQQFSDEVQFYTLKNDSLNARRVRLRYELDEEVFAKQVLQMEFEVLSNEKITNEDIHANTLDDLRHSVDIDQIATVQPSTYFREQLNHELRRIRMEYEKKIEVFREENHRRFELELHRYQMHKARPIPLVNQEHEQKLAQHRREKREVDQQISTVRTRIHEIELEVKSMEQRIREEKSMEVSLGSNQRNLGTLQQMIQEREQQLREALRVRTNLKQQIEKYREQIDRYPHRSLQSFIEQEEIQTRTVQQQNETIIEQKNNVSLTTTINAPKRNSSVESAPVDEGTLIRFTEFDVHRDCQILQQSLNGMAVDEGAILRVLCNRTVGQRLHIREAYKQKYGQNLRNLIESEIEGSLRQILNMLLLSPVEHDCSELQRVLTGTQVDENILIEIFLTRTSRQMQAINENYFKLFKSTLAQDLSDGRDSFPRRLGIALLQKQRPDDETPDPDAEIADTKLLHQNTAKWRMNGSTFIELITQRSNDSLKRIFAAYEQFGNNDIEKAIKTETDVELSRSLMAVVRLVRNRPRYFAYELRKSLKGPNTNEDNLNRIIISRCEIDMVQIKSEYEKITKRTLYDHIQTDTSGNYKRALLELLRQRLDTITTSVESNDYGRATTSDRPITQLREVLNKQFAERFSTTQSFNGSSRSVRFDRDNQAKSTSLLALNGQRLNGSFSRDRRINMTTLEEFDEDH